MKAALQAEKEKRKPQGAKRGRKRSKPLEEQSEENPQPRKRGKNTYTVFFLINMYLKYFSKHKNDKIKLI